MSAAATGVPGNCVKRAIFLCLSALAGTGMLCTAHAMPDTPAHPSEQSSPTERAHYFLEHLEAGRVERAHAMLDQTARVALPIGKLKTAWETIHAQAGALLSRGAPEMTRQAGIARITVPLEFERVALEALFTIDAAGGITAFHVRQAPPPAPLISDPVPIGASYTEREVAIGRGEAALPATVTMPTGNGPFPAVVLVHGSGPQDRDQSIGPNRPFADIARGLAAQGIAVLRYDKRSKVRPQDYTDAVTIDGETTDDAVVAVATLRATPGIDPGRVFVLGHSLGGMMAPRIATRANAAGMILFAAPARPLLDILLEQVIRMAQLDDGRTSSEDMARISTLRAQIAAARDAADQPASRMPLGQPQAYWRSTEGVDPIREAAASSLPFLLLQGGRDIQVTGTDWQRWQSRFDGDPKATFKFYPALNHLGIAGEGAASLRDYAAAGHVDAQLIADVAAWIQAGRVGADMKAPHTSEETSE